MKVLVTGGSGRLGQFVLADLLAKGYEPVNASRRRGPAGGPDVRYIQTDLTDVGQVAGAMFGCDGVIHLGAIPGPSSTPGEVVFANNTQSTFAVLQAAHLLGIRKVVVASSVSAYGMAWAEPSFPPLFAPLDETHPFLVADPYGLSKDADERTAEMFHRRNGSQVLCLRFHWVANPEEMEAIAGEGGVDPSLHKFNLWGYVDGRDAASACRLAFEADGLGFDTFNVVAEDTLCARPTRELIDEYLPDIEVRQEISGNGGGFAIDKAERLIGWRPLHSWRDYAAK